MSPNEINIGVPVLVPYRYLEYGLIQIAQRANPMTTGIVSSTTPIMPSVLYFPPHSFIIFFSDAIPIQINFVPFFISNLITSQDPLTDGMTGQQRCTPHRRGYNFSRRTPQSRACLFLGAESRQCVMSTLSSYNHHRQQQQQQQQQQQCFIFSMSTVTSYAHHHFNLLHITSFAAAADNPHSLTRLIGSHTLQSAQLPKYFSSKPSIKTIKYTILTQQLLTALMGSRPAGLLTDVNQIWRRSINQSNPIQGMDGMMD
mmetsp:Transcript_27707/g.33613  ORF Transcript_27707/g.33613 Transcript_27707/m.33613 type:complete len:257 (-) Transcript_27707:2594-3364(-)